MLNTDDKKIDILMATYNGEKYIKEQIDSIIGQTYQNWQLIIRDDCSNDQTRTIIDEYLKLDNRIRLIEDNKKNLGFVKNFEQLLKHSKADYIMFADQDDFWDKTKIEKLYNVIIKENKEIPLLVHCNSSVCNYRLKIIKKKFIKSIENKANTFLFSFIVQGASIIINNKMKEICIPFLDEVYLHDRYLHLLAELLGKRYFLDESLMYYRQHDNNQIGSKSNIIKKILNKRYFEIRDRNLLYKLYLKYGDEIEKEKKKLLETYFLITNTKKSRFIRFYLLHKNNIYMNIKKQIFLMFKG